MTAIFITATGTDVGKTFMTAGLIRELRRHERHVDAIKPVISGFDMADLANTDTGILLAQLGRPLSAENAAILSPWRFKAPLSPDMAARREGATIDFDALLAFSQKKIRARQDVLLIEGAGGIMTPLDESRTVLDWIIALRIPVLLVAGSYLGGISHTLSAIEVLTRRNISIKALIVSETLGGTVPLDESVATIRRFSGSLEPIALPRLTDQATPHPAFERLFQLL